jgi:hypothetical protein
MEMSYVVWVPNTPDDVIVHLNDANCTLPFKVINSKLSLQRTNFFYFAKNHTSSIPFYLSLTSLFLN